MGVRPPERIMTQRTTYLAQYAWCITDSIQQIGELGIMLREIIPINRGETAIMTAVVDFVENHDVCVIGAHPPSSQRNPDWSIQMGCDDVAVLREAHGSLPVHVAVMTPTEAELAKYFSNTFNALRVVFANEFYEVCRAMGASYGAVKDAMVRRSTIADAYLDCNERYRGFGGVCLPKDTAAFAAHVRTLGLDARLFETIVEENKKFRVTVPAGMRES